MKSLVKRNEGEIKIQKTVLQKHYEINLKKRDNIMDVYAVKQVSTKKIIESGFTKKSDAKLARNALCESVWQKLKKDAVKPFPFIVTKGKEHPNYDG
jgi:hypothetical protein|tara:strand:- start:569 stop:859 length:291 start_codon:yes stop_codon:yes gene_type:complete